LQKGHELNRVANPQGLTRILRVLTSGLRAPGLVLQSPGCEINWSKNLLFQTKFKRKR